jgi:hypothetical protein
MHLRWELVWGSRGPEFHLQQHLKRVASLLSMPCWMLMPGNGASSSFSTSSTLSPSLESQEAQLDMQQLVLLAGNVQLLLGLLQFPTDHLNRYLALHHLVSRISVQELCLYQKSPVER